MVLCVCILDFKIFVMSTPGEVGIIRIASPGFRYVEWVCGSSTTYTGS